MSETITAAVLVIGDEILSGRTQDTNTNYIARLLGTLGIDLKEARVVGDVEDEIVAALNALRTRYTYVFTTGGIGPTHDDITADAVAKAFGTGIDYHPEALALLAARYKPGEFNDMRKRMARVPLGAELVRNTASVAPGIHIGNVYVMAGVPMIMRAMMEDIAPSETRRGGAFRDRRRAHRRGAHRRRADAYPEGLPRAGARLLSLLPRRRLRRAARRARPRRGEGRGGRARRRGDAAWRGRGAGAGYRLTVTPLTTTSD